MPGVASQNSVPCPWNGPVRRTCTTCSRRCYTSTVHAGPRAGPLGVLASEGVQKAHQETVPGLFALGLLRLYSLRLADRTVASFYGFTHTAAGKKRAYFYLSGFDPALAGLSLGSLVIDYAVRTAVAEGAAEFDFLRGRETYKYCWGAQDFLTYRRRLWHP